MSKDPPLAEPELGCRFYKTEAGAEPVRDWLRGLEHDVRREVGSDIQKVQWRWPVGPPLVAGLGHGLFEVRTDIDDNIYRVFFCIEGGVMWLLHGIMKKSRTARKGDLDLARKRQREVRDAKP